MSVRSPLQRHASSLLTDHHSLSSPISNLFIFFHLQDKNDSDHLKTLRGEE